MAKFMLLLLLLVAFVKADFVDEDVDDSQNEEMDLSSEELDLSSSDEMALASFMEEELSASTTLGARQNGYCVLSNGGDQNSGVVKASGSNYWHSTQCRDWCSTQSGITGCEYIWNQGNRGCYKHTQTIARGNGAGNHYCWLATKFSKDLPTCNGDQHSFLGGRLKVAYAMCDGVPNAVVEWDPKLDWSCDIFGKKVFSLPCSGTVCSHTFSIGVNLDFCDALIMILTMGAGNVAAAAAKQAFAVAAKASQAVIRKAAQGMKNIAVKQAERKAKKEVNRAAGGMCDSAADAIAKILDCISGGLGAKFNNFAKPLLDQLHKIAGSLSLKYDLTASWDVSKRHDRNSGGIGYGVTMTNKFGLILNVPKNNMTPNWAAVKVILTAIGANNNVGHGCKTTNWARPKIVESMIINIFPEREDPWDVRINCGDATLFGLKAEDVEKAYKDAKHEISKAGDAVGDWGKKAEGNIKGKLQDVKDEADRLRQKIKDAARRLNPFSHRRRKGPFRRNLDEEEVSSEDEFSVEDLLNTILREQN